MKKDLKQVDTHLPNSIASSSGLFSSGCEEYVLRRIGELLEFQTVNQ